MNKCATLELSVARQHFNWGFHDAASDVRHGRPNKWKRKDHFCKPYKSGYLLGYFYAKHDMPTDSSDAAWEAGAVTRCHCKSELAYPEAES